MKATNLLILIGLVSLVSCKATKVPGKTLEMADTTQQMAQTTQNMSETTNGMSVTTRRMARNTDNMYLQIRTKESQETRDRSFKALDEAETFEEKLTKGAAYFQGFEYQLWTNGKVEMDTKEYREELMLTAIDEFFRSLKTYATEVELDEISPTSKDNTTLNLYALAVTLHEVNAHQVAVTSDGSAEEFCMLSMIKDALKMNKDLEEGVEGAEMKEWMDSVLLWEDEAKGMLNLRYQMLGAMTLSKVSEIANKPDYNLLGIPGLYRRVRHIVAKWDTKFPTLNQSTQHEVNKWLEEAIKTRQYLESIGVKAVMDGNVKKVLKKMNIPKCEDCSRRSADETAKFKAQIEEILK